MDRSIRVAEHVIQILESGNFTSTYKQAVLVALLDLCMEGTRPGGHAPDALTTRQLAEKVVELYWPQTRVWSDDKLVLAQNNAGAAGTGRARIVQLVREFRLVAAPTAGAALSAGRAVHPDAYERLVRAVEWKLVEMPLPKLQRVGGQDTNWLYAIAWDDGAQAPLKSQVSAYQRGKPTDFDNTIRLQPGVGEALNALHGILRPFVLQHWSAKVASLNRLDEQRLPEFLFGVDRTSLQVVRRPLLELQGGLCFYCQDRIIRGAEVDHFIPWARHPENAIDNLVVAHGSCNGRKRDHLAGVAHVERWAERSDVGRASLDQAAQEARWAVDQERVLGIARAMYLTLPGDARLWVRAGDFEQVGEGRERLATALVSSVAWAHRSG